MKPLLFVPSHNDVAQDVLREADRALELARLLGWQRELEHPVMAVTVVGELVGEPTARRRRHFVDLAAEGGDGVLEPFAHRHRVVTALPADRATRVLIDNWIAKKGAQLHVQHERWERGEDEE